jgi:hypothetical protein
MGTASCCDTLSLTLMVSNRDMAIQHDFSLTDLPMICQVGVRSSSSGEDVMRGTYGGQAMGSRGRIGVAAGRRQLSSQRDHPARITLRSWDPT